MSCCGTSVSVKVSGLVHVHSAASLADSITISLRRKVCAACDFNVDNRCQHLDCKTCPGDQSKTGGLMAMQTRADAVCAAAKW